MAQDNISRQKAEKIHNNRFSSMGRRQVLKALSVAGVGGLSTAYLTSEDVKAASSDEVPIVYGLKREELGNPKTDLVPMKKNVPADWYNDVQHAEKVRDALDLHKNAGVNEVDVRPAKYGGRSSYIEVGVSPELARGNGLVPETAKSAIPESHSGVEIKLKEVGVGKMACYTGDYGSTIPGGAVCRSGVGSSGTFSSAMFKNNNGPYFATNAHLWAGASNPTTSYDMNHNSSNEKVADIIEANCQLDYALGDPDNHTPQQKIVAGGEDVTFQYTKSGINDQIGQGAHGTKRGISSCETSGEIYTANGYIGAVDKGCPNRGYQVKGEWDIERGDSGSVAFIDNGSNVGALSMNAGFDPLNDNAFGFGAYRLKAQQGLSYA